MKDSYLTAGIRLSQLLRLLNRNKISYSPKNIFRLVFLIQGAAWSSLFSAAEKFRYSKALKNSPLPDNPIFIVGHWRTGSTFLHQLMSLDPQLYAPTLFQVALPDSFLVSYRYYRPVFNRVMSGHRPMDHVKIGIDEPQEDEYAIFRITDYSPLEQLVFPKSGSYFLKHPSTFPEISGKWKDDVMGFYRKLHFFSRKRIVSKNPFNSYRIETLAGMFPSARFIHIVRHPDDVIPSAMHMWNILQKQNCLGKPVVPPGFTEVTEGLSHLLDAVETGRQLLPGDCFAEIRFEDLEKEPLESLKKIYHLFNMNFSPEFEGNITNFLRETKDFRKNEFSLAAHEKSVIRTVLKIPMERYNYL
ncbi:MAG: sulfotransferase [Bacteroidota bacterium]